MKAKRRALIMVLVGAVGVLSALLWKPLRIQYRLHQLRSDDAGEFAGRVLCELGADAREPLLDMIHVYASAQHVARFRPLAFDALVCLRINVPSADPDFAPDREAIDALGHLYDHEPSADNRDRMEAALYGLDDWTYFLLWERLALSVQPRRLVYYGHRYWPPICDPYAVEDDLEVRQVLSPESAAEWCEHVAQNLQGWLDDGGSRIADPALVACVLDQRCGGREEVAHE